MDIYCGMYTYWNQTWELQVSEESKLAHYQINIHHLLSFDVTLYIIINCGM